MQRHLQRKHKKKMFQYKNKNVSEGFEDEIVPLSEKVNGNNRKLMNMKGKKNKNGDIVIDVDNDMRDDVKIMGNDMNNDRRDRIEIGRINRYLDEYSSEVKFNRKKL